jgi:hypothetical protein
MPYGLSMILIKRNSSSPQNELGVTNVPIHVLNARHIVIEASQWAMLEDGLNARGRSFAGISAFRGSRATQGLRQASLRQLFDQGVEVVTGDGCGCHALSTACRS